MTTYFAARHQVEHAYGQLLSLLDGVPQGAGLIGRVLAGASGLVETTIGEHILALAAEARMAPDVQAWLRAADFDNLA